MIKTESVATTLINFINDKHNSVKMFAFFWLMSKISALALFIKFPFDDDRVAWVMGQPGWCIFNRLSALMKFMNPFSDAAI